MTSPYGSTLEAALDYASRGWRVLILHSIKDGRCTCGDPACDSKAKHPRTAHGVMDATTDHSLLHSWWKRWPNSNVGIATGVDSATVLDVDPRHGGDASLAALEDEFGKLPDTVVVQTGGGGRHFYFAPEQGILNSAGRLGAGLDIRGEGGYVVAPTSVHLTGKSYTWEASLALDDLPLAQMPKWLIELTRKQGQNRQSEEDAEEAPKPGNRNTTLASEVGKWVARGFSEQEIRRMAHGWNRELSEPLPDQEVNAVVDNILKCETRNKAKASATPWPNLKPLSATGEPPKFDIDAVFPESLAAIRDYCEALAASLQLAPEASSSLVLPVLAVALAQKFVAKPTSSWTEWLALMPIVLYPPANLKSPLIKAVTRPVALWERAKNKREKDLITAAREKRKCAEKRLEKLRRVAADAEDVSVGDETGKQHRSPDQLRKEAEHLAVEIENMKVPAFTRVIVSDATPEALVSVLAENHERALVASAEADFLDVILGRYSNGKPNLALVLKAWSGDFHRHDRVSGPPVHLDHPHLSICLAVQPTALEETFSNEQARGRGMTARFLVVMPKSRVSERTTMTGPSIPEHVVREYEDIVTRLLDLPVPDEARTLALTPEAYREVDAFFNWIEPQLGQYGALAEHGDWGGKAHGTLIRIACIYALTEKLGIRGESVDEADLRIRLEHVQAARGWMEFLVAQWIYTARMLGAAPEVTNAGKLLAWIEKESLTEFTGRDALNARSCRSMGTQDEVDEAIQVLVDHGVVRARPELRQPGPQGGRRPSPTYDVNPAVHSQENQQNQQNCRPGGSGGRSAGSAGRSDGSEPKAPRGFAGSAGSAGTTPGDLPQAAADGSAGSADGPIKASPRESPSQEGLEDLPDRLQNLQNNDDDPERDAVRADANERCLDEDELAEAEAARQEHRNGYVPTEEVPL